MNGLLHSSSIASLLQRLRTVRVWVVGDVMLDEYVEGRVDRISPEAPVPVMHVGGTSHRLGGAANVAHGCAALGAQVSLGTIIGEDDAGRTLAQGCQSAGIGVSGIVRVGDRPTTRKLRVMARGHQMLRLDWERSESVELDIGRLILAALRNAGEPDVIVLSDYAKGLLSPEIVRLFVEHARSRRIPVLVDPKSRDFSRYAGATVVTPNLKELESAAGRTLATVSTEAVADLTREVARKAQVENLVVTLGERGMVIVPRDGEAHAIPAVAREVFDVTGAGDTAVATLALALAAGADLRLAATVANAAAGLVVGKVGTAVVTPPELAAALSPRRSADKVLARETLIEQVAWWRLEGRRISFTNGCFDILHAGHLSLLRAAAKLGDVLIVAINSDDSVRRLKGPERPLVVESERAALLAALDCVDAVTIFGEDTPLELLGGISPDVLVKGGDYTPDQVVGRELVEARGGRVAIVPLVQDRATSGLVRRIRGGEGA